MLGQIVARWRAGDYNARKDGSSVERGTRMNTAYAHEFLVFSKTMNYSDAARELFISRSTLRDHIQELEFELKVPLVDKSADGPQLTPYGKQFIPRAKDLCRFVDGIVSDFENLKNNYLNVRVSYSTLSWLRMRLLKARMNLVATHPEKAIEITTSESATVDREPIDNGKFDLGVLRVDNGANPEENPELFSGLCYFKMASSKILMFTGTDNPVSRIASPRIADLAGETLLVPETLFRIYAEKSAEPRVFGMDVASLEFSDFEEYYMADYSRFIGTVPEKLVNEYHLRDREDCVLLDMQDLDIRSDFYLICRPEFLENPTAALLFEELRRVFTQSPL